MESTENLQGLARAVGHHSVQGKHGFATNAGWRRGGAGVQPLLGSWPVASEQSLLTVNNFSTHGC